MGVPIPKIEQVDNGSAEALLSSLLNLDPAERRKHASVFNYWLSIRGDRQFPPIRDLDPLEISDAGPWSVLLELIGAGENAVVRHLGQDIKLGLEVEMIARAPESSLLSCIHAKLPEVASTKQPLAFEDSFGTGGEAVRCWITLLPFSTSGTWIDYVYGFVSLAADTQDTAVAAVQAAEEGELEPGQVPLGPLDEDAVAPEAEASFDEPAAEVVEAEVEAEPEIERADPVEPEPEDEPEVLEQAPEPEAVAEPEAAELELPTEELTGFEPEPEIEPLPALEVEPEFEPEPLPAAKSEPEPVEAVAEATAELEPQPGFQDDLEDAPRSKAGFSARFMESLASVGGFYGRVVHPETTILDDQSYADQTVPEEAMADETFAEEPVADGTFVEEVATDDAAVQETVEHIPETTLNAEGTLQSKLSDVRAMAEEARQAQLRSQVALIAGLSAAYDFALDAESEPEEYLRLVEGQGMKIQLRSPMKPVVKLAFADTCDAETIAQLEAVLAWALKMDLPRGTLAERIESEGGVGVVLEGLSKAA